MDLADLEVFANVAHAGSFASVARHRATDPSAISRIVAAIEAELGTRLFHRTTRSMTLTEAGRRFLQRTEVLLEDFASARAEALDATDVPAGVVRLTASVGFAQVAIVPLLPELCERYPQLVIDLVATDAVLDLSAEGIDLAVRLAPRPDGDYVASLLRATRYHVVASPDFAQRHQPKHPEELARMPAVVFPLRGFKSRWMFRDGAGKVTDVAIQGRVLASSSIALRDLARNSVGAAILGDWLVARDIATGELVDLFPQFEVTATEFETAVWLLYPSRKFLPAKTRVTMDFLREKLGR